MPINFANAAPVALVSAMQALARVLGAAGHDMVKEELAELGALFRHCGQLAGCAPVSLVRAAEAAACGECGARVAAGMSVRKRPRGVPAHERGRYALPLERSGAMSPMTTERHRC